MKSISRTTHTSDLDLLAMKSIALSPLAPNQLSNIDIDAYLDQWDLHYACHYPYDGYQSTATSTN